MQELNNCLVLFDDIDAIRDKKLKKVVTDLCDELQVRALPPRLTHKGLEGHGERCKLC